MNRNSTLFFFFSTLFEILPWENGFQLWVGCFPGSRSLKATSETSGLFSFKSLENSQRTAGNHLSTAIIRVNLEKKKNRLLFLIKGPFSTVITATSNFSFPTSNFSFPMLKSQFYRKKGCEKTNFSCEKTGKCRLENSDSVKKILLS